MIMCHFMVVSLSSGSVLVSNLRLAAWIPQLPNLTPKSWKNHPFCPSRNLALWLLPILSLLLAEFCKLTDSPCQVCSAALCCLLFLQNCSS